VRIYFLQGSIKFVIGNYELISRLINAKYPDYNSVIPKETKYELLVNSNNLKTALKRLLIYTTGDTKKVILSIQENKIILKAYNDLISAEGSEEVDCTYSNTPFEISFNGSNLEKVISSFDNDDIVIKMNSPEKTVLIKSVNDVQGEDFLILTVPIRLNK